ncbi:MAG: hypothetical protein DI549_00420 [Ancylobacter novellus]|uniref:Uncharacterized protein n=1 Tax=Ancylobacter novellus TaxID=921 RepID=A0A2W5RGM0_ANCNO|nr:MAG: hypothetical protein DI549_00420 [Ancylobacter novellus]
MKYVPSLVFAAFLLASAPAALASPCEQAVKDTQEALDRLLADLAATGPSATESDDALLSHEPTPGGIADVEAEIGDGVAPEKAQKALDSARAAVAAGDEEKCQKDVAAARDAIGLQ